MWHVVTTILSLVPIQTTPRMIEGLSNGDFEYVWQPTSPTPVKGAFWVGAETRIQGTTGAQYLRLPANAGGPLVYQRVSCGHDRSATLSLGAKVRIAQSGDAGSVTLIETLTPGDGTGTTGSYPAGTERLYNWNDAWHNPNCTLSPQWTFNEVVAGNATPISPCNSPTSSGNIIGYDRTTLVNGQLVAEWTAPYDGTVRIVSRGIRLGDVDANHDGILELNPVDVQEETLIGTSLATATPVKTVVFDHVLLQGTVVVTRVAVTQGIKLFFRASLVNGGAQPPSALFEWHPQIAYEGRRLTWWFTNSLFVPVNTPTQHYKRVAATAGSWTTITNVQAAALFKSEFGLADYPEGPFEIELGVPTNNANRVDFDDISLKREFDEPTANVLRQSIITEARWVRDNYRLTRDRDTPGRPGQLGPVPTPYQANAHTLYVDLGDCGGSPVSGPCYGTCGASPSGGSEPQMVWDLLQRVYDDTDYEDYFQIREQERRQKSAVGLLYKTYDVCQDQFTHSSTEETSAGRIREMVRLWELTNDPTSLDVAYAYGKVVAANGVFFNPDDPTDPRNGLLFDEHYSVGTGYPSTSEAAALGASYAYLSAPVSLLAGYIACTNYNAAHPALPMRYDPAELSSWLSRIKTDAVICGTLKIFILTNNPSHPYHYGGWESDWSTLTGYFSDNYAFIALFALDGLDELAKLPQNLWPPDASATHDALLDLAKDGAQFYIGQWEQAVLRNEVADGDNARSWFAFARLMPLVPSADRTRYADQLLRAATHAARFQYAGGFWVSDGQAEHQQLKTDLGGNPRLFLPPGPYPNGMGQVFKIANLPASTSQDWLAILKTIHQVTMDEFRSVYGYRPKIFPAATGDLAGSERNLSSNYLGILDSLPTTLPEKPSASVAPASLTAPPPLGTSFSFTIHFPTGTSVAALQTLLNNKVRVIRWSGSGTTWTEQNLWPSVPGFFQTPLIDPVQRTVTLKTAATIGSGAGEFKFDVHAWDDDEQWDRDTSYQVW